jgi:AraC-like DNA-binding protein
VFDAPVRFGQATNALVFDAALICGAMADPDPLAMSRLESGLAARRPGAAPSAFEAALRGAVAGCFASGGPRRIDFNTLVADLRRERALLLLAQPGVKLTDIAMSLGYSEHSAFTRAFRGWTGMSPRRYRDLPRTGERKAGAG